MCSDQGGLAGTVWLPCCSAGNGVLRVTDMIQRAYRINESVVYCLTKHSVRPGQRARLVDPAPRGDWYTYCVDKYWLVEDVLSDNELILRTRRGKRRRVRSDDPNLRRPSLWERLVLAKRFPKPSESETREVAPQAG